MSDTTNSGADPWGLPENEPAPPPEPSPEPEVGDTGAPAVVSAEEEPAGEISPARTEEATDIEPPEESTPEAPPADPEPAPPTTRGPLSQVLAASGLFGGTPVPPRHQEPTAPVETAEPSTPAATAGAPVERPAENLMAPVDEPVTPVEPSLEEPPVTLEPPAPEATTASYADAGERPPDLSSPVGGSSIGIGATDDDLPLEPPPWMTQDEPAAPADLPKEISTQAGAVLDEEAGELPAQPEVDTDIESLVAEIADGALDTDAQDIAFHPEDTPSVFRVLQDLPKSGDQFGAALDDFVEPATVAFEEAPAVETPSAETGPEPMQADEPRPTDESADEAERFGAEWGVFESPERPDAPVFGVSFGRQPAEAPPEAESDEAPQTDIAPAEPFAGSEPAAAEPVQEDVPLGDVPGDELLVREPSPDEAVEEPAGTPVTEEAPEPRVELAGEEMPVESGEADLVMETPAADAIGVGSELINEVDAEIAPDLDQPTVEAVEEPAAGIAAEPMPEIAEPDAGELASEAEEPVAEIEPEPVAWGSRWQESAQGWVEDEQGRSTWRPIVTTSPLLSEWKIDTYLGVVTADVVLGAGPIEAEMAGGRTAAMRAIINDAMARGAHAVVGVTTTVAPVGSATVLTATGTAVTLKAPD